MSGEPTTNGQAPFGADFHPRDFRRGLRHLRLDDAEYRVAMELCEFAAIGRPIVWPGVKTLAEHCGMTPRGVQGILLRLEAKGVIACVTRSKGGRGHTTHWQLLVQRPQTTNGRSRFTGTEITNRGAGNYEPPCSETTNGRSPEVGMEVGMEVGGRACVRETPPTPEPQQPRNDRTSQPSANSNSERPAAVEPSPFCPRHPGGTDKPCKGCQQARERVEALTVGAEREHDAQRQAEADRRAACPDCDHGFVDVYDDDGNEVGVRKCTHPKPRRRTS